MTDTVAAQPAWLPAALAYVTNWLEYQMRSTQQPGCVLAVASGGALVLETAFGHANAVAATRLTPRHRFRVASHSKSFTAAAIMKLREQGRVKLDDTAGQYVAGLHPGIAAATVAQLLSHTAGIFRDGTDCAYWLDRAPFSDAQRIRADLALPPAIDANTRLKYSNHGFALAGLVIEAITGEPYATWVAREVVAPAGLRETTPDMPIAKSARFASGHSLRLPLGHRVIFPADGATHALAAATGFVSTAADLVRFFSQLAPTAAQSFLSPASRREMIRPHWREAHAAQQRAYGLGIISGSEDGWDWFGHSGGFQGTLTRTAVVPAQGLAVSVLTNAADGQSGVWLEGVLRILKTFAEGGAPTTTAADWAGRWWSVWGAFDLVPVGDKVLVGRPGLLHPLQHAAELAIEGPDRGRIALDGSFGSHGEPVRRVYGKSGAATELWLAGSKLVPEKVLAQELTRRYAKSPS